MKVNSREYKSLVSKLLNTKINLPPLQTNKYSDVEVEENVKRWIKEYAGGDNEISLKKIIDILRMIEEKTSGNPKRIIFYQSVESDKINNTEFANRATLLKAGFVAKSFFVGIMGSVVTECILDKNRLDFHIYTYQALTDIKLRKDITIEDFMFTTYKMYDDFSLIFNLDETFHTKVQYDKYKVKEITAKLKNVDVWDLERL
jgi:hypothetical protein